MSFGKWFIVFSLALVIFLVATSAIASPIDKGKTIDSGPIILNTVPAPGIIAANLVWNQPAGSISNYRIERSTDGGATWTTHFTISAPSTTFQDVSVARGGTYWYRIFMLTDRADSVPSNVVSIFITDAAPTPPVYLAAVINTAHSITLSWNTTTTALDGYIVERAVGQGPDLVFQVVGRLDSPLVTTWIDTKLSSSTRYTYRVRAFSQIGISYPTNPVEVVYP